MGLSWVGHEAICVRLDLSSPIFSRRHSKSIQPIPKVQTMKFTSIAKLLVLPAALLVLSGCAGMHVGPGTTTGVVGGAIIGAARGDAGKGAIIGGGLGAVLDILSGQQPIEVDPPYRDGRIYRDDRRPLPPVYRDDRRYHPAPIPRDDRRYDRRPVPAPVYDPRYDRNCGCYR